MRVLLLTFAGLVAAGPARAEEPPEGPALQVYLEPAKLAGTPWGKLLRLEGGADTGGELARGRAKLAAFESRLGVPITELKSLTLTVADPTAASGKAGWILVVEFAKPYDKAKLTAAFAGAATVEATSPTALTLRGAGGKGTGEPLARPEPPLVVFARPQAFAGLLPEPGKLPPEFKVFKPLADQDLLMLTGNIAPDGAMTLDFGPAAAVPDQAAALTTSLDVLRQVLRTVALGENAPAATQYGLTVDPVLVALQPAFNSAKVETASGRPRLTLSVKPDPALAPALAGFYGALGGDYSPTQRKATTENLKQVALGFHVHLDAAKTFPASAAFVGKGGTPLLSWRVAILPHVGHEKLYKMFRLDEPFDSAHNLNVLRNNPMPDIFKTPGIDTPERMTRVQGFALDPTPNNGEGEMMPGLGLTKGVTIEGFNDGTSNTLLVTVAREPVEWTKPADIPFAPAGDLRKLVYFGADGLGELLCVFADGSARALRASMKPETFRAVVTRNGGEVVDLDE